MAHGMTVSISDQSIQTVPDGNRVKYPKTWWEEHSNIHYAKRWLADTEAMIIALHEAAGKGNLPFAILGMASYHGTLI